MRCCEGRSPECVTSWRTEPPGCHLAYFDHAAVAVFPRSASRSTPVSWEEVRPMCSSPALAWASRGQPIRWTRSQDCPSACEVAAEVKVVLPDKGAVTGGRDDHVLSQALTRLTLHVRGRLQRPDDRPPRRGAAVTMACPAGNCRQVRSQVRASRKRDPGCRSCHRPAYARGCLGTLRMVSGSQFLYRYLVRSFGSICRLNAG
jgi:hypothetical protein